MTIVHPSHDISQSANINIIIVFLKTRSYSSLCSNSINLGLFKGSAEWVLQGEDAAAVDNWTSVISCQGLSANNLSSSSKSRSSLLPNLLGYRKNSKPPWHLLPRSTPKQSTRWKCLISSASSTSISTIMTRSIPFFNSQERVLPRSVLGKSSFKSR